MAGLLETAHKVAGFNRIAPHLKGLRFKGDRVYSTNLTSTFRGSGLPYGDLDCFVDSDAFMHALKSLKNIQIIQDQKTLTIKNSGKSKVDLDLQPLTSFTVELDRVPQGEEVDPNGLLAGIRRLLPLLKLTQNQLLVLGKHLYCYADYFVVRTPHDTEMPELEKPLTVSQEVAELVSSITEKPLTLMVAPDSLTFCFENCSLETMRFSPREINDYESLFVGFEDILKLPLEEELAEEMKAMLNFSKKDDVVYFSEDEGIRLLSSGKQTWHIDHPMPPMIFSASMLKTVLSCGREFSFNDRAKIVFSSPDLEGFWAARG